MQEVQQTPRRPKIASNPQKDSILIAEDSPTQAERLKHILEEHNFDVIVSRNGKEALASLKCFTPRIVISDIVMPEMDGFDLCRQIKGNGSLKDIPVILLTSLSDPKDVLKGLECGANSFVVKPLDEQYLLSRIHYVLANEELRRQGGIRMGMEILFGGQKYFITSDRVQILDLLLSTYESAILRNHQLSQVQEDLRKLNEDLETKVQERTANLLAEIAERKRAEESRDKLEEQLRQSQKMEAIGQLAGGVAHDFNNILMAITAYCELLLMKMTSENPIWQDVQEIQKVAEQGSSLTRQLLAFSRKQVLEPKIIDLNQVVANLDRMMQRLLGENINLYTFFSPNLGKVKADPTQIEQVVINLAVNARDALADGGKVTIETANVDLDEQFTKDRAGLNPGEYVMLAVSDNGCGMDEATISRIFEPFFTTKEKGKGTGLGLSTVYGIVTQSGGTIWVYSEVGMGTTFKIYLPRVFETGEAPCASGHKKSLSLGGFETILFVDDDFAIRTAVGSVLKSYGYTVLEASHAEEALEIWHKNDAIDLVITDLVLPQMSGREMAQKIKEERPEAKVLFMSGYAGEAIQRNGILDRSSTFLQKPAKMQVVLQKVRDLLEKA